MATGSEIAAGAGAGASLIPALFGRGQSSYNAQDISHSGMYDPNAARFGAQGAGAYAGARAHQANAIDQRGAYLADYQQADMDRRRALEARANQSTVMNQLMARAAGTTPSIAQMQADRQMGQAAAQQAALQSSARGRGALANAQTTAANNTANAAGAISNQAQINAANERLQAEQAAFGAASGMRGQDYAGQGQAAGQAQFQAGMQQTNRNANDARAMGYEQMGHQALGAEQQGKVQMQGIAAQSHANAQAQNAQTERQNAGSKGLIETVGDFFSDARAKMVYSPDSFPSDFLSKTPAWIQPMSGPAPASFDQLDAGGGGMDVTGSLQKHSDFATQFAQDATGGMGQTFLSDKAAKDKVAAKAFAAGQASVAGPPKDAGSDEDAVDRIERDNARMRAHDAMVAAQDRINAQKAGAKQADREAAARIENRERAGTGGAYVLGERATGPQSIQANLERAGWTLPQSRPAPAAAPAPVAAAGNPFLMPETRTIVSDFAAKEPAVSTWGSGGPDVAAQQGAEWDAAQDNQLRSDVAKSLAYTPNSGEERQAQLQGYRNKLETFRKYRNAGLKLSPEERREARQVQGFLRDAEQDGAANEFAEPPAEQPQAAAEKPAPSWLESFMAASKGLNDAQFGSGQRFPSDFKSKSVDVDYDPGGQDFDADEYHESKAPKPRDWDELHMKRDTPADQKAVKRAYEDKAGKDADSIMASYGASLGKGSAVKERIASSLEPEQTPEAVAARTMRGYPYAYKPGLGPKEQAPGELNYGFMTQNLRQSPVAATAVKKNPETGLDEVDAHKMIKVQAATIADLQKQQDETRSMIAALFGGGKAK